MLYSFIWRQMKKSHSHLVCKREEKDEKSVGWESFPLVLPPNMHQETKPVSLPFASLHALTYQKRRCPMLLFFPSHRKILYHNRNIRHICHKRNFTKTAKFSITTGTFVTSVTKGTLQKRQNSLSQQEHLS
jgi:hypothetical protein